jgi:hypothetical protein
VVWAEATSLPLPTTFLEARDLYDKILSLTNPIQRVREIHASRALLEPGAAAIRSVSTFTDKWGKAYRDSRDFSATVNSIEYHLLPDGAARKFLANWDAACSNASVVEDQIWRDLQDSKAAAQVELESQKARWRDSARSIAQQAIDNLPTELDAAGINDPQFQAELKERLESFLSGLADESSITRAPLLTDIARAKVQEVGASVRKRQDDLMRAAATADPSGSATKKPKRLRLTELGRRRVVATLDQWETLDTAVRNELAAGNEVEIV